MRKVLFALMLSFLIVSCSSDSSSETTTAVLLKKTIQTTGDDEYIADYHYNGDKLSYIDFEIETYCTYTGNLITGMHIVDSGNTTHTFSYTYDSAERLISSLRFTHGLNVVYRSDYTYNPDGTVTQKLYVGDETSQTELEDTRKFFYGLNGDIVKIEREMPVGVEVTLYAYDNEHNPMYNIRGYSKLMLPEAQPHNITGVYITSADGETISSETSVFTYNEDGYPVTMIRTGNGMDSAFEYFYE